MLKLLAMPAVVNTSLPLMPPNPQQDGWRAYFSWMDNLVQKTSSSVTGNRPVNYGAKNHPEAQRLANGLTSLTQQMHRISVTPITTESLMDNDHLENASMSNKIVCNVDDVFLKLINYFRNLVMNNDRLKILDLDISVKKFYGKLRSTLWREADKYVKAEDTSGLNIVAKRLEQTTQVPELPEYDGLNTNWEDLCDWFAKLFSVIDPTNQIESRKPDRNLILANEEVLKTGLNLVCQALRDLSNAEGLAAIEKSYQIGDWPPYVMNIDRHVSSQRIQTADVFPTLLRYFHNLAFLPVKDDYLMNPSERCKFVDQLQRTYYKYGESNPLSTGHSRFEALQGFFGKTSHRILAAAQES